MSCPICACDFTSTVRKPVTCPSCAFESCQQCTKTYLLGTTQDAHCMGCRIAWSYNFLIDNFSKAFVYGDYNRHREDVLVERERSKLVETMHLVDNEKQKRVINKDLKELRAELNRQKEAIKNLKRQIANKSYELRVLSNPNAPTNAIKERKQFFRACPAANCKGFLSTQWECGLCQVRVCPKCHEIKSSDGDHTCKQENIDTATAVMKETKPCPKCAARIFKIDGCDQIWCTSCRTAFSWRTGSIENDIIHNPHYFEYIRRHGGAPPPPRECGGVLVNARELVYHLRVIRVADDPHPLVDMLRGFSHIYRNNIVEVRDTQEEFAELRLRYLVGDFDEKRWKQLLQACEKRREKSIEMRMILDTLVTVSTDMFRRALQTSLHSEINVITDEMKALIDHINESLAIYASKFGCSVTYHIHPTKYTLEKPDV